MYRIFEIMVILILLSTISHALENTEQRDREVSVRKAIDSFGRMEQKEISIVNKFKKMFTDGKVTGQVRSIYAGYNQKEQGVSDSHATAIGGMLKYELASFNGFNAGIAFVTSQDIEFLSGDESKHNPELSSQSGHYTELSEAYINYKNGGLNLRVGRQMFDTPLADSDDSRMIPNTFEAYLATYERNNLVFTVGNVQKWQGAGVGLGYNEHGVQQESNWVDTGSGGTWFGGVNYSDAIEFKAWYYDISKSEHATKASYFDIGKHTGTGEISVHASVQYLHESEVNGSGVEADIFGALVELVVHGIGFNVAYNKYIRHEGKRSFSGIGGGHMYTSMDTMLIDEITQDREAQAIVAGLVYDVGHWNFLYAYGDFDGKANSAGVKAHIVEHNAGFEYTVNDEFVFAAIYVKEEDKVSPIATMYDFDRVQVMAKYNF